MVIYGLIIFAIKDVIQFREQQIFQCEPVVARDLFENGRLNSCLCKNFCRFIWFSTCYKEVSLSPRQTRMSSPILHRKLVATFNFPTPKICINFTINFIRSTLLTGMSKAVQIGSACVDHQMAILDLFLSRAWLSQTGRLP